MEFILQPSLKNEFVSIQPLNAEDFEALYQVASDPLIWEQHPNPDRYKREVFLNFFNGALESKGAFLVFNAQTGELIGSSRFYGYDPVKNAISIGYTFLSRASWGTTYNRALKSLMLQHAFQYVNKVHFHIGAKNIRSQKAIERLGAKKIAEENIAYYGEKDTLNFIYEIEKADWINL